MKPAQDIYELGKERARTELKYLRNESSLKHVAKCLRGIEKVKTFWSDQKEVSLLSFYYPSRLQLEGSGRTIVDSLADLPPGHNYVIEGTVGQGKSIFLRYLASKELKRGPDLRIPIFVELRFLQADETFEHFIFSGFEAAGLKISQDLFEVYANSGRVVLFLDAFDELDPDLVKRTIRDLDRLIGVHPRMQIVVSARPDSDIQRAPGFRVVKLFPLVRSDHKPFLQRLTNDRSQTDRILKAIGNSSSNIDGILTTPLLLTLLVLLYASQQHIPDTVSAFYAELFDVLFYKHDRTKSGFRRKRHVDVSDSKIKKIFEGVCFFSVLKGYRSLKSNQFAECLEYAGKLALAEVNVSGFKDELVKTACLLKEEGTELSFIHRSVQEFYSAAFVANSSDEFAQNFYSSVRRPGNRRTGWHQQLEFLKEIDEWRYAKFYWLPCADALPTALGIEVNDFYSSSFRLKSTHVRRLIEDSEIGFFSEAMDSEGRPVVGNKDVDLSDIVVGPIEWNDVGSYSEPALFGLNSPLSGVFYALFAPLTGRWFDDSLASRMDALASEIRKAAQDRIRRRGDHPLRFDGLDLTLNIYDDGAYSADFALLDLIDFADAMDMIVAEANQAIRDLALDRKRFLAIVAAEEQKNSMLKLMTSTKHS